jgi:hypothetical protein
MLFDLQGKRKRAIQVIYVGLALLMGVGLVGLGIGSSANGGLFDALGIGGSGTSSGDPTYTAQIDKANAALSSNPKDEKALLSLSRYEFLTGQSERQATSNGSFQLTSDAISSYGKSVDAWERYLATKPQKPNDDVAALMVQAYQVIYSTDTAVQDQTLDKLTRAAQIVADARPALGTYTDLATFAYYAGNDKLAAEAKTKALAAAPDDTTRKQVQQQLTQAQAQAVALAKQQKQQAKASGSQGSGQLPDPTQGLGSAPGSLLPSGTAPPTP